MNFRNIIDITPWDKSGYSFWGLTRIQAKYLALFFIFLGISLADPPFSGIPTDFFNLFIADKLSRWSSISFAFATLLSYTVIAWSVILLGIWIYPYHTPSLLNSYINKAKLFIKRQVRNPVSILIGIILFYLTYNLYKGWLL